MKYLNGKYYVEVKDKRYKIHPTENIILRERKEPKSLRTQYQVINNTKIRRNQRVIKDEDGNLIVKSYPKKNKIPKENNNISICPSCQRNALIEYPSHYQCEACDVFIQKSKPEINKKDLRKESFFGIRLPYADKKLKEIYYKLFQKNYTSYKDILIDFKNLGKKLTLRKNYNEYYKEMQLLRSKNIFPFEDRFAKTEKRKLMIVLLEALMLIRYFQTKPELKTENINYYDMYYTILSVKVKEEKFEVSKNHFK